MFKTFGNRIEKTVLMRQVHSSRVRSLSLTGSREKDILLDGVDGMIFTDKLQNIFVGVRIADCMPIYVYYDHSLTGMIHAGWKGIADGIHKKFVDKALDMGMKVENISFYAGPHICKNCFEVGDEIIDRFPSVSVSGNRVSLFDALSSDLLVLGVRRKNINLIKTGDYCTYENNEYYSNRRGDFQRMIAFAIQY
ncbi:polyphenol oxidase family protein [Elusimicrobiota bacterium]